jgi:hypothetical protein
MMADTSTGSRRATRWLLRRFLPSVTTVVPSKFDFLLVSSDMLLQSIDRVVSQDCPRHGHQTDRQDGRPSEKIDVPVPLGLGNRFVEKVDPAQEKNDPTENTKIAVFSHCCLAKRRLI